MRLIPIVTAILVTLTLYAVVFARDALLAFAKGDTEASEAGSDENLTDGARQICLLRHHFC